MAEQTPLYAEHLKLQGKIVDYAGFSLPVQFPAGIAAEHLTVRESAGLFDVSHMGEIEIRGRDTYLFLDFLLPRDLSRIGQAIERRRALYSVMCASDGTAIDDLLIYPLAVDRCLLVVNAANIAVDEAHIRKVLAEWPETREIIADVVVDNQSSRWAQLALQGPKSLQVLTELTRLAGLDSDVAQPWLDELSVLGRYQFTYSVAVFSGPDAPSGSTHGSQADTRFCSDNLSADDFAPDSPLMLISRTGYTGEDGFEFYLRPQDAPALWHLLIAAGASPIGLGARDTLRLEAAMPLYGHELSRSINPREAGLDRFLSLSKLAFLGKSSLEIEPSRTLIGLVSLGKAIPRADYPVLADGRTIGYVTSGTFSPSLGKGIALALIDKAALVEIENTRSSALPDNAPEVLPKAADLGPDSTGIFELAVEIRGRAEPFARCALPFL